MKRNSYLDGTRKLTKGGSLPRTMSRLFSRGKKKRIPGDGRSESGGSSPLENSVAPLLRHIVAGKAAQDQDELLRSSQTSHAPMPMELNGSSVVRADQPPLENEDHHAVPTAKRVFDILCIILSCPILLPLMVLMMLAVKLSSPGPIFFRQERVGYRGRPFMIYKFRSMRMNADTKMHESHFEKLLREGAAMIKLDAGDPRIIPWGRALRATGLDELPQVFNVLRGEMSLVGPRPCTAPEFAQYQPWQTARVNALPGMTGYWQVHGKNRTTFNEMIDMDIFYTEHVSLSLDIEILLKTVPAILQQVFEMRKRCRGASAQEMPGSDRSLDSAVI
jgi:lipopolysaccharide/colanic/teichoic acid biosynthesis glycosyltransferase